MNRIIRLALPTLLGFVFAGQALAHGLLVQSIPAGDSVVAEAPTEITLRFNERIEGAFSGIDLRALDGAKVATGKIELNDMAMTASVSAPLAPGIYQVDWHVLSADGHKVEGTFKFEVQP